MFNKTKEILNKSYLALGMVGATLTMKANALAVSVNSSADAENVGNNVIGKLLTIVQLIGGGIAIFGIVTLGLAIMNPDSPPEKKTQGIATLLAGAIIAGATVFLKSIGILQ